MLVGFHLKSLRLCHHPHQMECIDVSERGSSKSIEPAVKVEKKILNEDEYIEGLEAIITRDFFPDLPRLRAQGASLEGTPCQTPRTDCSETPSTPAAGSGKQRGEPRGGLDAFLAGVTSEDNASFQSVVEQSDLAHRQKHPWLYADEGAEEERVRGSLEGRPSSDRPGLVTWKYKNRNALMYTPDGVPWTPEEALSQGRREIRHGATRFLSTPHAEEENREAIAEASKLHARMSEGKVGIDGRELLPKDSPQVGGYGFVATPTPQPGVEESPLMTWGEVEGTPFRLDSTPVLQFKMPGPSARERIAHTLADKAASRRRAARTDSSSCVGVDRPSPKASLEKLLGLSPAAQRLAYAKLGIQRGSDRALRESYSPSPSLGATPATPSPVQLSTAPKRHKASDFF